MENAQNMGKGLQTSIYKINDGDAMYSRGNIVNSVISLYEDRW